MRSFRVLKGSALPREVGPGLPPPAGGERKRRRVAVAAVRAVRGGAVDEAVDRSTVLGGGRDADDAAGRHHGGDVVAALGQRVQVGDGGGVVGLRVVADHDEVGVGHPEGRVGLHGVSGEPAPVGRLVLLVEVVDDSLGGGLAGNGGHESVSP